MQKHARQGQALLHAFAEASNPLAGAARELQIAQQPVDARINLPLGNIVDSTKNLEILARSQPLIQCWSFWKHAGPLPHL